MPQQYLVRLTDAEREMLNGLSKQRRAAAQQVLRARVRRKAEADGPHWTEAATATACDGRPPTIANMRERFVTEGCASTWHGTPKRRVRGKGLDGRQEAQSMAWRLGPPPSGGANGTLRLCAAPAVALALGESVRHATLRRTFTHTMFRTGRAPMGACRRPPRPSSPRVGRTCWRAMPNPRRRGIRYAAWMRHRYSS
jgi:hypothetical protein